jgi:hypothetical protein
MAPERFRGEAKEEAMMRIVIMALAVAWGGVAVSGGTEHAAHAAPADARFDFLKGLAGRWVAPAEDGKPGGAFEFRVTAGGHAVEEREFVGTPMEMMTVYHVEGRQLVANHYCMIGNRPRFEAAAEVVDDTLAFACAGRPGGARSHDDEHVHAYSLRLDGAGNLHMTAEMAQDGKVTEQHDVVLTRERESASR